MIDAALQLTCAAASVALLVRGEPALCRLGRGGHIALRASLCLLVVGAVAQLGAIVLFGFVPTATEAILSLGIAALLCSEPRAITLVTARQRCER